MKAFTVMWRTIKATYEDLLLWVWLSVLWWIGTVPFVLGLYLLATGLLEGTTVAIFGAVLLLPLGLVVAGPATAGIHNAANRVANYRRVESAFFWEGARSAFGKSLLLLGINALMIIGVVVNIEWYRRLGTNWSPIVSIMWVWILIIVLMAGQFFFPLLWQQDEMRIKMVLRNAFILALRHPLYTFFMFAFQVILVIVSIFTVLPIFLLTPAAVVLAMNFSLVGLLQELDLAPEPPPGA